MVDSSVPLCGGCHCGAVRFTVDLPESWSAHRCNCSICLMKGTVMIDVPLAALTITQGEDELTLYTFNTGEAKHRFCRHCGIHPFHQLRSNPNHSGVSAACIDGMSPYDFVELAVHDGQNHPRDNNGRRGVAGILRFVPGGEMPARADASAAKSERRGACHCGGVRFAIRAPAELRGARCNCSICSTKGTVMVGVRLEDLEILDGQELLSCYRYNSRQAQHFFCSRCGIHCFHQRRANPREYAVNAACIEGVSPFDFSPLPVFDGRNHPADRKDKGESGTLFGLAGTLWFEPAPG